MILKFLHINGKSFSLDMNNDATIEQTKIALIYLYKLQYHALEFLINGRILNDEEIISQIGYFNGNYIIFYEPDLSEDVGEISPFFGSVPQVCHPSGAPSLIENSLSNSNNDSNQDTSPFQDIEKGNDQKYLKYVIEPSFIQETQESCTNYNLASFNGNEIKFNATKKPTKFQNLYKTSIDELTKSTYPQDEILQKTKKSVDFFYEKQSNSPQIISTSKNSNTFKSTTNSNIPQNMNTRTFANSNLPTYNTSNLSHPSSFNNNIIANSQNTPHTNSNYFTRIDFNHPSYLNQPFQRNSFS